MMTLLMDHPAVRRCRAVRLGTRDAQTLYERFGFVAISSLPPREHPTTEMIFRRQPLPSEA
jgi:hypothetical protein